MEYVFTKKDQQVITIVKLFIPIVLISVLLFLTCTSFVREINARKRANAIVAQIEDYRKCNGKLPNTLDDIQGLSELEEEKRGFYAVLYEKIDETYYVVSYGKSFDENWYYYSDTKEWIDRYRFVND